MREIPVDPYTTCTNCGYRIRPGWKCDEHAEVCGKCAEEVGTEADCIAVNDEDYTRRDPWRGSEYDHQTKLANDGDSRRCPPAIC